MEQLKLKVSPKPRNYYWIVYELQVMSDEKSHKKIAHNEWRRLRTHPVLPSPDGFRRRCSDD